MASSHADRIIGLYDRLAAQYDRDRQRSFPVLFEKPWLDRFAGLVPPGSEVLDLGCGAGRPIAEYLIQGGFHVTGVDSSPAMIGLCKTRFPESGWIVADMRRVSLRRRFSGILAWNSFFHLTPDDQRAMFAVFANHAAPGGALMFTSGPSFGEAIGEYGGEPLYHASLSPEEYRLLLSSAGFEVVAHIAEDPNCNGHTIWLAKGSVPLSP